MDAKPVIDVVLAVEDSGDEATYVSALEDAGYRLVIRDPKWYEHRLFNAALDAPPPGINLHVFSAGCPEIDRMIRFRDQIRSNDADRDKYLMKKHELAARTWEYMQGYADAKGETIREILEPFESESAVTEIHDQTFP